MLALLLVALAGAEPGDARAVQGLEGSLEVVEGRMRPWLRVTGATGEARCFETVDGLRLDDSLAGLAGLLERMADAVAEKPEHPFGEAYEVDLRTRTRVPQACIFEGRTREGRVTLDVTWNRDCPLVISCERAFLRVSFDAAGAREAAGLLADARPYKKDEAPSAGVAAAPPVEPTPPVADPPVADAPPPTTAGSVALLDQKPDFRGIAWGGPPAAGMTRVEGDATGLAVYLNPADKLEIGGAPLAAIAYLFWRDRLVSVLVDTPDRVAGERVAGALEEAYGRGEVDGGGLAWKGRTMLLTWDGGTEVMFLHKELAVRMEQEKRAAEIEADL